MAVERSLQLAVCGGSAAARAEPKTAPAASAPAAPRRNVWREISRPRDCVMSRILSHRTAKTVAPHDVSDHKSAPFRAQDRLPPLRRSHQSWVGSSMLVAVFISSVSGSWDGSAAMSSVSAAPESLAAAASEVTAIGSSIRAATGAAAAPTTSLAAAAGDDCQPIRRHRVGHQPRQQHDHGHRRRRQRTVGGGGQPHRPEAGDVYVANVSDGTVSAIN